MRPCRLWELSAADQVSLVRMLTGVGADIDRLQCLEVDGNPLPQARARGRGKGRPYTPAPTRAAQASLAARMSDLAGEGQWRGNLALVCIFHRDSCLLVDGDNLLKLVQDAGTQAKVWKDDSQITGGAYRIELDRRNPRTIIGLAPHVSTLRRDLVLAA